MEKQIDLFNSDIKKGEIGVYPMIFVLVPLPYQDPKNNIFTRKYNNVYMTFSSITGDIPSGKYPRSLLSLITTQFMKQYKDIKKEEDSRIIELGNITEVARLIGLKGVTGGRKGTGTLITKAMVDLGKLNLTTHCKMITDKYEGIKIENMNLFSDVQLLWNAKGKNEKELFNSFAKLSFEFAKMIKMRSVPINLFVYNELKTARQQDLYSWAARKFFKVNKETFIPYDAILPQFFDKIGNKTEQKDELRKSLLEVVKVYPDAKIKADDLGITLFPSKLPVPEKELGYI